MSIEEAATIVGMLKNPSLYNPKSFPENAKRRRSVVLNQMKKHKYITADQYEQLKQVEVDMSGFSRKTQSEGPAPYFRFELRKTLNKILASDECRKPDGEKYDIFRDGLKIYTTLDPVHTERGGRCGFSTYAERTEEILEGLEKPGPMDASGRRYHK